MNLAELKEAYKARKLALDSAKKEEEKYKALLKDAMLEAGESDYTDEAGYRFERIVQERKSMDEEKLLAELHERNLTGCIKTVEAVDEDATLKAVEAGELPQEVLLHKGEVGVKDGETDYDFPIYEVHKLDVDGSGRDRTCLCKGESCEFCKSGNKPQLRMFLQMINKDEKDKDKQVQLWERGLTDIKNLIGLAGEYGDLTKRASYNENGGWGEQAERDLLAKLDTLDKAGVKFGLSNVFESKGKENIILKEWAKGYTVHYLDHTYSNCSYHKKDKQSKDIEVFITNY